MNMELQAKAEPENNSWQDRTDRSSVTLELERDAYKEKLEHYKIYVRELQQTMQSMKIRHEGVETVSKLLSESRQEIATLTRQKKALETAVRNLQNRLAGQGLSTSVTFEENEIFIPGTSKQILDNLAKENARLRTLIVGSGNFEDESKLRETVEKLKGTIANLQVERDNLQQKVTDLENILQSSENEKDKQISQYMDRIKNLHKESRTQDVLCHSMAGELGGLRKQLHEFVVQCQGLEMKLEESEKAVISQNETEEKIPETVRTIQCSTDSPDGNILREENQKLKEKLVEVTEMNRRWQEYNNSREKYVQDLCSKYSDLEARYKKAHESQMSDDKQKQIDRLLITAKEKLEKAEESKRKTETELKEAKSKIENLTAEKHRLQNISGDSETINALKAQIQLCTEDFETERQDREKAQSRVFELQGEIEKLKRVMSDRFQVQNQPVDCHRTFNLQPDVYQRYNQFRPDTLHARGIHSSVTVDGSVQNEDHVDDTKMRHFHKIEKNSAVSAGPISLPVMRSNSTTLRLSSSTTADKDVLCCPKCSLAFPEDHQDKLLEHMEYCCE